MATVIATFVLNCILATAEAHPSAGSNQLDIEATRVRLQNRIATEGWTSSSADSSCGIYAACRAMSLLGIEATPSDYYTIRYVGADSGSTPAELMKLLEKNHCNAVPMVNLSKLDLISLGYLS